MPKADNKVPELSPIRTRYDWKAYYYSFVEAHGEPVNLYSSSDEGRPIRLVFPDGWTYGLDYAGPEYPPPTDHEALRKLQTYYWSERLRMVREELRLTKQIQDSVRQTQAARSMPLKVRDRKYQQKNPDDIYDEANTIHENDFDERIEWLFDELTKCDEMLESLSQSNLALYKE